MAQELAFAMPATEEMTETAVGVAGAAVTGIAEGVIISIAPQLGALETPFTWAALLGIPAIGIAGALMTKGILGEAFKGVAYASAGYAASVLPAMVLPEGILGKKGNPTAAQRAAIAAGADVKQLPQGIHGAAQRAQAAAARSVTAGLEF